ncbi:hypothetical protein TNCV_2879831 [Trichonephila clavipes]|uniref:Uncharacterized protein n=1 Tax=Trichonephila clavipes TaxID=2585209 RepID=A0A8X7BCC9_TRICX|nr:hypothetical protein TNCV_2879831 [Trichonephila clavipes]
MEKYGTKSMVADSVPTTPAKSGLPTWFNFFSTKALIREMGFELAKFQQTDSSLPVTHKGNILEQYFKSSPDLSKRPPFRTNDTAKSNGILEQSFKSIISR